MSILKGIVLAVLIILLIYLIYTLFHNIKYKGETCRQRQLRFHYINAGADTVTDNAQEVINLGENLPNPRAIDHLMIGTTYLLNAGNRNRAREHFQEAIDNIVNRNVDTHDIPFIIERIDDLKLFLNEEIPLQGAIEFYINDQRTAPKIYKPNEPNIGDPDYKEKHILAKQRWESDSQNVHDQALSRMLADQLALVRSDNELLNYTLNHHNYAECVDWLRAKSANNKGDLAKINDVLKTIDLNNPIFLSGNNNSREITERDFLDTIWKRIHDPRNNDKLSELKNSLYDSVIDCVESGKHVCISGRCKKLWQTFALLDYTDTVGIMKSKQMIRNEIYEKCCNIIKNERESVSNIIKADYDAGKDTEDTTRMKKNIIDRMEQIKTQYNNKSIDENILNSIIDECKAEI